MMKMVKTIAVVGVLLAAVACGKKSSGADATAKMTELKDAMCKCKAGDSACANKVLDDQKKWAEEMAKTGDKNAKPDPEAAKKLEPITAEFTKCMTAAMTPAAAAPTGCPAGATKVEEMGFCITLPASYTAGKPENNQVEFEHSETMMKNITVYAKDGTLADANHEMFTKSDKYEVKGSGELLGGKGQWFHVKPKGGKGYSWGVAVMSGKKLLTCEQASTEDSAEETHELDICKTITLINP